MERIKCRGERAFWSWRHFGVFRAILGPKQVDPKHPKWCQLWNIRSPRHFIRSMQIARLKCSPWRAESIYNNFGTFPAHFSAIFRRNHRPRIRPGFLVSRPIYFLAFDKSHSRFSQVSTSVKETFPKKMLWFFTLSRGDIGWCMTGILRRLLKMYVYYCTYL